MSSVEVGCSSPSRLSRSTRSFRRFESPVSASVTASCFVRRKRRLFSRKVATSRRTTSRSVAVARTMARRLTRLKWSYTRIAGGDERTSRRDGQQRPTLDLDPLGTATSSSRPPPRSGSSMPARGRRGRFPARTCPLRTGRGRWRRRSRSRGPRGRARARGARASTRRARRRRRRPRGAGRRRADTRDSSRPRSGSPPSSAGRARRALPRRARRPLPTP